MQGVAVAIGFIVVWAAQNAILEARLVDEYGPLALPRMNIPGILLGDFLNLSAARSVAGSLRESGLAHHHDHDHLLRRRQSRA